MKRAAIALTLSLYASGALADELREIPDPTLTPGVIASTDEADVCGTVDGLSYSKRHRQTPAGLKALIRKRYGVTENGDAEIDHRVPLALGGEDSVYNLWWQPGNNHGARFTYHDKDRLEQFAWLHACRIRDLPLPDAQAMFLAPDWRIAYCAHIGGPPCD